LNILEVEKPLSESCLLFDCKTRLKTASGTARILRAGVVLWRGEAQDIGGCARLRGRQDDGNGAGAVRFVQCSGMEAVLEAAPRLGSDFQHETK